MKRRTFLRNIGVGAISATIPSAGQARAASLDQAPKNSPNHATHPITGRQLPLLTTGVIAPVFTPGEEGGRLDAEGLSDFVGWLAQNPSISALFIRGGLGKMYSFTHDEIKTAIVRTMDAAGGQKPAFFGAFGEFDGKFHHRPEERKYIDESIELSKYAEEKGAAGVVLLIPWMLVPKHDESIADLVVRYVREVAQEIAIPVVVYNSGRLPRSYGLTGEMVSRLAEIPNVIGAKVSTRNASWLTDLERAAAGTRFSIIVGSETIFYQALMTGSLGVIGAGCNVYPAILDAEYRAFVEGRYRDALTAQWDVDRALEIINEPSQSTSGLSYAKNLGLRLAGWNKNGERLLSGEESKKRFAALEPLLKKYRSEA